MYIEGCVPTSSGEPIPGAVTVINTREMDDKGEQHSISVRFFSADASTICDMSYILLPTHDYYDTQCARRPEPDRRGRLRTYRAFVPVTYPVPEDVRFIFPLLLFTSFWSSCHVLILFCGTDEKLAPVR
jgi:hypothetical protein